MENKNQNNKQTTNKKKPIIIGAVIVVAILIGIIIGSTLKKPAQLQISRLLLKNLAIQVLLHMAKFTL